MNAVEIEEAISELASAPFDAEEFPRAFLEAFNNKPTTVKRLLASAAKNSDVEGGVLQYKNIHLAVAEPGKVNAKLAELRASPKTTTGKVRFILATDGQTLEAEDLVEGDIRVCDYRDFPNHFGFFLPLAGITTVKAIKNNPIDIQATGRLNRLYVELLKGNPDWATDERRHDLNQFMARLIFCFFAEDTGIFLGENLFTRTLEQMSDRDNAHDIISELFRAMDIPNRERAGAGLRPWADAFPYVNGGLFAGSNEVPRFSRIARSYLLHAGSLDWKSINPDIFGSMIQAVAEDEERGELGMHYTSVPNILKVLNPLFLDDLRAQLEEAGDNPRKLLNLRKRLGRIRVFDPACGSGNFLVIAYKEMRAIEAEILSRRLKVLSADSKDREDLRSVIPLKNFYGIEIKDFACEIARLSLLIAEYQCDVDAMGQERAGEIVLPLKETGRIKHGNALRLDWLEVCPPPEQASAVEEDLAGPTGRLALEPGDGGDWETYICGNPPYLGSTWQSKQQKDEIKNVVAGRMNSPGFLDYVSGWFLKAAAYIEKTPTVAAFVTTNSICQGQSVPLLWPMLFASGCEIRFAHTSFKWTNLASNNAGVTVAIVGIARISGSSKSIYEDDGSGRTTRRQGTGISPYLTLGTEVVVTKTRQPISDIAEMEFGNKPTDGGHLLLDRSEIPSLSLSDQQRAKFIRRIFGSGDFIGHGFRHCVWINDNDLEEALKIPSLRTRIEAVRDVRLASRDKGANALAARAHQLKLMRIGDVQTIVVPGVSSERREYLPAGLVDNKTTLTNLAFGLYDAPIWNLALVVSKLHLVWIATVCGKMKTDFRYSNTLGWNTFPVPALTEKNKADLTRCAEDILLAREHYFPATIADMYDPDRMDEEFPLVREAHERNDETLERIYIGRRFRNDTERLEKLFDLYTKMTAAEDAA
ncbi:MAG: lactate dehydrogenase [Henriciella sp.]|uniref:class I SAM-dependent DNA methyltransferase n=1 Tax=uncultured Henriciella sp. TaxID=1608424 RepID=UPI000C5930D6|nr:lactate dehydrogenase [Henriciella sp.]QYJ00631.1 lactate dehydrogenase [Thalassovita mediterranea]